MKLDYLVGHRVSVVSEALNPDTWNWYIELESGIKIMYSGDVDTPVGIENSMLGAVAQTARTSKMVFYSGDPPEKVGEVKVNTKDVTFDVPEGYPLDPPEQSDPVLDLPPDPSVDRVAEGPENPPEE